MELLKGERPEESGKPKAALRGKEIGFLFRRKRRPPVGKKAALADKI